MIQTILINRGPAGTVPTLSGAITSVGGVTSVGASLQATLDGKVSLIGQQTLNANLTIEGGSQPAMHVSATYTAASFFGGLRGINAHAIGEGYSTTQRVGALIAADDGLGASITSYSTPSVGAYHAWFGDDPPNMAFVATLMGAVGWFRGAFTGRIQAAATLTADRTWTLPDKDGTVAMLSDITGGTYYAGSGLTLTGTTFALTNAAAVAALSGANTGDETGGRIAALLNAATPIAALADDDRLGATDTSAAGTLGSVTGSVLWTWITAKLGALTSLTAGGAWAFSTRPTSSGAGAPAPNSLISSSDALLLRALSISRIRQMTAPVSLTTVGSWTNISPSAGVIMNSYSVTAGCAAGSKLIDSVESFAFSKPLKVAVYGRLMPGSTASNCVARLFVGNSGGGLQLADAANPVIKAGFGVEFYAAGGAYRARLFFCSTDGATVTYSSSIAVSDPAATTTHYGYLLDNPGDGNLAFYVTAQSSSAANSNVSLTGDSIVWTGAISNTALAYTPVLQVIGATPATGIVSGVGLAVYNAMVTL